MMGVQYTVVQLNRVMPYTAASVMFTWDFTKGQSCAQLDTERSDVNKAKDRNGIGWELE